MLYWPNKKRSANKNERTDASYKTRVDKQIFKYLVSVECRLQHNILHRDYIIRELSKKLKQ